MAGAEFIEETEGINSDDNSASMKHKEVYSSYNCKFYSVGLYVYTYVAETACKEEFHESC